MTITELYKIFIVMHVI